MYMFLPISLLLAAVPLAAAAERAGPGFVSCFFRYHKYYLSGGYTNHYTTSRSR
jgi:hypothetical protein